MRSGGFTKSRLAYRICHVIAAMGALTGAAFAAGIATIQDVENEGYRTPPGGSELGAKPADELVQNEALRTEDESVIHVRFVDGSELSVEALSQVELTDYVFDGNASAGLINLNNGLFHFTSNGNNDQGVKLRTPVATIGVRGTEFLVHVDGDQATIIDILDGQVEAAPRGTGKPATCNGGQSILIASADDDAVCGDIGSFSTAAGPSNGPNSRPEPGHGGQARDQQEQANLPPQPSGGGSSSSGSSSDSSSGASSSGSSGQTSGGASGESSSGSSGASSSGSSGQTSGGASGNTSGESSSGSSGASSSGSSGQTSGGASGNTSGESSSGSSGASSSGSSGQTSSGASGNTSGGASSSGSWGTSGQSSGSTSSGASGNSSGGASSSGSSGTSGQSSGSSGA
jgi:hypothetical protein